MYITGLDILKTLDPPRMIKTHLPFQLVPPGFWENKCKVRDDIKVIQLRAKSSIELYCFKMKGTMQVTGVKG